MLNDKRTQNTNYQKGMAYIGPRVGYPYKSEVRKIGYIGEFNINL